MKNGIAEAVKEVLDSSVLLQPTTDDLPVPEYLPKVPTIEQIKSLEREMKKRPQLELEPVHHFADGLYARELSRPAGTLIVGKIHAKQHFYLLLAGEITAWTEHGMKRLKAPTLLRTEPGTKRVTYAHTDTTSITFHATRETNLDKLEAELIIPDLLEFEAQDLARIEMEKPT